MKKAASRTRSTRKPKTPALPREFPYQTLHGRPVLPPEQKQPIYRATNTAGLSGVIDVYGRALGSLRRIAASDCCVQKEAREAAEAVAGVLRKLHRLDPEAPTTEKASFALAREVLALGEGLARNLSPKRAPGIGFADRVWRTGALLAPQPGAPLIVAIAAPGGEVPIPPDEAARILTELIRILEEAIRRAAGANGNLTRARELLELLRRYRDLVAAGGAVTLAELAAFLKPFFAELLAILRGLLSREAWIALGRALVGIAEQLAAYLGGTACGAPLALFWYLVAILAAAGLGYLLGRLIGRIRIGDQTIDDHLADFFYWLLYAPPGGCEEFLAAYLKAMERFRQLEATGAPDDARAAALAEAIYFLGRYIDLKCEDDMAVYRRELDRLLEKLKSLVK